MSEERVEGILILIFGVILTPVMILWSIPWYDLVQTKRDFWFNVSTDVVLGACLAGLYALGISLVWRRP